MFTNARFIFHSKKTAFIVEHDFIMATYLADRVIVYDGQPSVKAHANSPESLLSGMNRFLKDLEITFRRDPGNFRPRINKYDSVKDKEQKVYIRILNCSLAAIISFWIVNPKINTILNDEFWCKNYVRVALNKENGTYL